MEKQLAQIQKDIGEVREAIRIVKQQISSIHELARAIQSGELISLCVILQPGDCHTFQQSRWSRLVVTNETSDPGSVELRWGTDVFTGEVLATETRSITPMDWPATICNVGTVPLKVCPA